MKRATVCFEKREDAPDDLQGFHWGFGMDGMACVSVVPLREALESVAALEKQNEDLLEQVVRLELQVKKQAVEIRVLSEPA